MDQRQLAEKMFGKAERSSYISDVESGKAGNVTVERLEEFAIALSCQPASLLLAANSKPLSSVFQEAPTDELTAPTDVDPAAAGVHPAADPRGTDAGVAAPQLQAPTH